MSVKKLINININNVNSLINLQRKITEAYMPQYLVEIVVQFFKMIFKAF